MTLWLVLLAFLVLGIVACGPAVPPDEEAPTSVAEESAETEDTGAEQATEAESEEAAESETEAESADLAAEGNLEVDPPTTEEEDAAVPFDIFAGVDEDEIDTRESGLQIITLSEGDGPKPEEGEVVLVHYTGYLEDGTQFDSSLDRGQPFGFAVGQGRVIPGWDEGISQLNVGTRARLIIPPELGYGSAGAGGVIPPDATLIFDVELLEVTAGAPEAPREVAEEDYEVTESGVRYYDFSVGEGAEPQSGQPIVVHYTGWLEDGTKFDSSLDRAQPLVFLYDAGQVIPGWDAGLSGMKVGGERQIVIPPDQAYGEEGAGNGVIPPDATLIFEVELVEVTETEQ